MSMNLESGNDSPVNQESNAPSQEQQSKESTQLSIVPEGTSLQSSLPAETGGIVKIKNALKEGLVNMAENESSATLSQESKNVLTRFVDNAVRGFVSVVPMVCKGHACPYITSCPLKQAGSVLPKGKRCPVEDTIASIHITKHLQALGIDNMDDATHSFDMDMLCELAGLELIRWRAGAELAKNPNLIIQQASGATQDGDIIYQDVPHPILDVLDKTGKHINKIREALVATRKAQMEVGQVTHDVSQRASELRAKAEAIKKERLRQIKDVEFSVKEETDGKPDS